LARYTFTGLFTEVPLEFFLKELTRDSDLTFIIVQNQTFLIPRIDIAAMFGSAYGRLTSIMDLKTSDNLVLIGNPEDAGKYRNCLVAGVVRDGKGGICLKIPACLPNSIS